MNHNPTYFLASLGAGGLAISFFMYLMFLVPHPTTPIPTFENVFSIVNQFNYLSLITMISCIGIIIFSYFHFKLLYWNTKNFLKNKEKHNNVGLMVIPLTYTMSINVCFVLGAVFVPSLWNIVEYLFPFAIIGFLINGYYALKILINFLIELIFSENKQIYSSYKYNFENNNNFSVLISVFCLTMIAVGFAGPGAMSHNIVINAFGIGFAIFFLVVSLIVFSIFFVINFINILKYGINVETTPTFLIFIPILTLVGITLVRIMFGLNHNINMELDKVSLFVLTSGIISAQLFFLILGLLILKKFNYVNLYINSDKKSPLSFALICPGVAFMVFGMFFINYGLVFPNIVEKYSILYFLLISPFVFVQIITIKYFFILKNKLI